MMYEHGKSDGPIVPAKPSNKADDGRFDQRHPASSAAEKAEGRGPVKGNPQEHNKPRTQGRIGVQQALARVRQAARKDKKLRFTTLMHHVCNPAMLREAYFGLKRDAAPGVDGQTWQPGGEENYGEWCHGVAAVPCAGTSSPGWVISSRQPANARPRRISERPLPGSTPPRQPWSHRPARR